ncbi:trypsin-like serine protease, partial [Streptomyces sp900105245]
MFGLRRARQTAAIMAAAAAAAAGLLASPTASAAPQPIVGGTTTTTTAYPFMMQITDASQNQFCGGTLVAPKKVVTAAHCMVGETTGSVRVVGGRTYLNGTNGTVSRVSKIWINPDYTDATNGDDVAVLTLSTSMPYTTAKYVSSSQTSVYAAGSTARILG